MANEIQITTGLSCINGTFKYTTNVNNFRADQTTPGKSSNTQTIGFAAHEALGVGADLGTPGFAIFTNLDTTNYVQVGLDVSGTFYPVLKIMPGHSAGPLQLATSTLYAQANVAAVELDFNILRA